MAPPTHHNRLTSKKMSISATYLLGHVARSKLSKEASKGDHNLRRLVGHANLLDSIMLDLADAEREQEAWLEETVSHNNKAHARVQAQSSPSKNIKWVDTILGEDSDLEIPDASDDEDSESDEEEYEVQLASVAAVRRARSPPPQAYEEDSDSESEEEYEEEFDDEDFGNDSLALTRTQSRRHDEQIPELVHDSDESDDETSPPNSPELFSQTHSLVRDFADTIASRKPGSIQGPVISDERHAPLVTAY